MSPASRRLPDDDLPLDAETRTAVLQAVIEHLDHYAFPEIAQKLQADLEDRLADGYKDVRSGQQLAATLTAQLQSLSNDRQLKLHFSPVPLPQLDPQQQISPEELAEQRLLSQLRNFDFNRVERLRGNIGYLELFSFEPPEFAGETAIAAMTFLAHTSALIVDLRHNRGGSPAMVAMLCSYLLPDYPPIHLNDLYWPGEDRVQQSWTLPYLPGQRYDQPVYVLIGAETGSAAEEFVYNLKQLSRATLVGETTAGCANPGRGYRLHDHFWMFIPTGQAISRLTGESWEGSGILPDFKVPAELAPQTAQLLAFKRLLESDLMPSLRREIEQTYTVVEAELNRKQQDLVSQLGGLR
ncbi:S41 family peptidase [Romeria aff. gracilis LEGE 07310]|uniref:S41 family peptidase n=1 Tax=Vasconcelosia minhoensis LEGE 07310 TaxID=915328 RepID=A0A8J7AQB2_9CYAN|nr:S41 family peptidase [Romeria gracilis]MBE9078669.1 S41 family peptidase [Romeria aff. gracilis LEGE 07310]